MIVDSSHFTRNGNTFVAYLADLPFTTREESEYVFVEVEKHRIPFKRVFGDTFTSIDARFEDVKLRIIS